MVFHPESGIIFIWRCIVLLISLVIALDAPLWNALDYGHEFLWNIFYIIGSTAYIFDIFVNLRTGFFVKGELVTEKKEIFQHYLRGWFAVDFLSLLGVVVISIMLINGIPLSGILHLATLLPILKIIHSVSSVRSWLAAQTMNPSTLRLIYSLFWLALTAHWIACGWLKMGMIDPKLGHGENYITALYWCVTTLTTIGYGDITPKTPPQIIFTMVVQIMGAGMYGYMIGNLASLIANLDIAKAQFQEKLEKVSTFMRNRSVPADLQRDILAYYKYLWANRRGTDEADIIEDLPISLKERVALFLNREIIAKVPLFQGASEDLIRQIVLKLKPQIYVPGDYVFRHGDIGNEMYFISKGAVEVVAADGKTVYAVLHAGDFFGEMALLFSMPRTAGARALEFSDLYMLEKKDFNQVLNNFPAFKKEIHEKAEQRKKELQNQSD